MIEIQCKYVTSRIVGDLDEKVIRALREKLRYKVPGFRFAFATRTKWSGDGFKYLITPKRLRFPSGLLHMVREVLDAHKVEYEVKDQRIKPDSTNPILPKYYKLRDYQQAAEKACLEAGTGIVRMATGGGKCISPESYIITRSGLKQFKDIIPSDMMEGEYRPTTLEVYDRKGWSRTSHIYYDGIKHTKQITTNFGYTIEGTNTHRILVLRNNTIQFELLGNLKANDRVVIQRGQNVFSKNYFDLQGFAKEKHIYTNVKDINIPRCLDEEFALFLGLWTAEGWGGKSKTAFSFTFSNANLEILTFMIGYLNKLGIRFYDWTRDDGCHDISWSSKLLFKLFEFMGCHIGSSAKKSIPTAILCSPKSVICAFLQGFFSGEASVNKNKNEIELCSKSRDLIDGIHILLSNFGIIASKKQRIKYATNSKTKVRSTFHVLYIRGSEIEKFHREIGFYFAEKQGQLEEKLKNDVRFNTNVDTLPIGSLIWSVRKSIKDRWFGKRHSRDKYNLHRVLKHEVSYQWLAKFLEEQRPNLIDLPQLVDLEEFLKERFFFDAISSIEDNESAVYDFVVPGSHSFFANGFINHNTAIFTSLLGKLNGLKCIVYVRKLDLMEQTIRVLERELDTPIGRIGGGVAEIQDISVAMIPTVSRALGEKWVKYDGHDNDDDDDKTELSVQQKKAIKEYVETTDCFVVDECHCISAPSVQMVSQHSKKAYYRFGFSATPWRTDGTDILLNAATGPQLIDISASELIKRGFLVPPRVHFYKVTRDFTKKVPNDYQSVYSQFIVENENRNSRIVKLTKYLVANSERPVILVQRQQHGKVLEDLLEKEGLVAKFIYGESNMTDRWLALQDFEAGVIDVIIGSSILQEGIDLPCITALINASAGKSSSAYYQKIGRAIRTNEGKTRAIVIDFLDQVKWLKNHARERIKVLKTEPLYELKIQE